MTPADPGRQTDGAPLGIVIPTLDEAAYLPALLDDLAHVTIPTEIVVADGGSRDETADVARARGVRVLRSPRGRARQMNAGAAVLRTPWILFLHADSRLPAEAAAAAVRWLEDRPDPGDAAHFAFRLRGPGSWWRFIEFGQRIRQRFLGLVYGDQGLLISRARFDDIGGFRDLPLFEDVEMVRALARTGPLVELPHALETSPRRYEAEGKVLVWLRNTALTGLYLLGADPLSLARWYGRREPEHAKRTLLVFAKAPIAGRVKTRVAAELGDETAARIYRRLGRTVANQVRHGRYRTVVCYDPPGERARVSRWLGEDLEYRPQVGGDLGERLTAAFAWAFSEADHVCVIGTDAPDVNAQMVEQAFDGLTDHGVVMGPAKDGGYYLLGLRSPTPELFRGVPWSTDTVAETTRATARRMGLSVMELPVLTDVDHARDVPVALGEDADD